jgi:aspartyl/asparaginyl beta-hydroxylase (cupin superfamily)/Tfp pilus assembly protein PilF
MQLSNQEIERLVNEGVAALQQGRPEEAREKLEQVTATGRANAQIWLILATICRNLDDVMAEEAALDRMLALEPQGIRGMIMKADCRLKAGDDHNALFLYKKALQLAEGQTVPQGLVPELQRARQAAIDLGARHTSSLDEKLARGGFPAAERSARFQQSLDIMAGRKQIFLQEPTGYFYPELPHIQYFPTDYDWVPAIEAATDTIREELLGALAGQIGAFRPYIQSEAHQPRVHPLLDKQDWSALFFCENGKTSKDVIARYPRTWDAVQAAPLPWIGGFSPTVMFSLLKRGTRIPAHTGMFNTRLVCHLPLLVPPRCGFRVGNEVREWQEGKLLIFDDTIEHEAWNESDQDRVVLIFDIWRPELSAHERNEVTALFAANQSRLDS